ncbi:fumarylacetoacetate hydrolase [Burkholderia sp. GAS332]|nr:fumarylacetoacetate hydrolase [Burkholderia sp. GAS332]
MNMTSTDRTHDPDAETWVDSARAHREFPIQNLPLGVFSVAGEEPRIGCAIGDEIVDLRGLALDGRLPPDVAPLLSAVELNSLFGAPAVQRRALRHALFDLLSNPERQLEVKMHLHSAARCQMHVPARVGDFTDFFAGIHHATNGGRLVNPNSPLPANYKFLPIAYHSRSSSIRVSGQPVRRPCGQRKPPDCTTPVFGPSQRLDYELELGVWIAGENELGSAVSVDDAFGRIAGFCLVNDWSARDLQAWEFQPLGPFLSKSFHTTISPWVVTAEAMIPFLMPHDARAADDPELLPYLVTTTGGSGDALSIQLEVFLTTAQMRQQGHPPHRLSTGRASDMYWTVAQMIAHHTVNGCNLMPADLLGSGTISSAQPGGAGCLLEISQNGKQPLELSSGELRFYLEDSDEIRLKATASAERFRSIGFGDCVAIVASGGNA